MSHVVVGEPTIQRTDDSTVVCATVTTPDAGPREVRFVLPPVEVHRQQVTDAMFVVGRLVAMKRGWPLVLPGPLSARLLDRAEIFQDVFLEWYGGRAKPIPLDFEVAEPLQLPARRGTISTFSGGVDSFFTVLENLDRLSGLLFIHGLDIGLEHTDFRVRVGDELGAAASELGVPLWQVETNVRDLTDPYANWGQKAHGSILSSVAILLAGRVETFLIPGTVTRGGMRGDGLGSHVMMDRLHSTDYLAVVHHGVETSRTEKVARVIMHESAQRHLRVCYLSRTDYNCGVCSKCRRTQVDLDLAGFIERDRLFAGGLTMSEVVSQFEVGSVAQRSMVEASIRRARALGRKDIVVPLKYAVRRYEAQKVKEQAIELRGVLRKDPEFRAAFIPRQRGRRRTSLPVVPPSTPSPAPTLRAVIVHRLPDSVVRRLRKVLRRA